MVMPRRRGGSGRGLCWGLAPGSYGWGLAPDSYLSCRFFPWLPRRWWTGIYGSINPYAPMTKEQEISMLQDQAKLIENSLEQIRRRLNELKKEE